MLCSSKGFRILRFTTQTCPGNFFKTVYPCVARTRRMDKVKTVRSGICSTGDGASSADGNRLSQEASPYLLQHANNPVDWYPWGEEAFSRARNEQKPIFLSIGYSTCHWCHVMEHESFEDNETAEIINKYFIPIKVDKEERPDVDRVYMSYVQASTGQGGWPMSVFLTPELKPFFGGTYFPKEDRFGLPSFKQLLGQISATWTEKQDMIKDHSEATMEELSQALKAASQSKTTETNLRDLSVELLKKCSEQLKSSFDPINGGFSTAPKFPRPSEVHVLLSYHHSIQRTDSRLANEVLKMVEVTMEKMSNGGIYDHIAGGFHRYSVDELWHVPHFEKMLYDNAQLANTYIDFYHMTKDSRWAQVASGILNYLSSDLMDPEGGIYSAEDADSMDVNTGKKSEGAFYVWTVEELKQILDATDYKIFEAYYQVKDAGNCTMSARSDPHGEFIGKNCLFAAPDVLPKLSKDLKMSLEEIKESLDRSRKLIHSQRAKRMRPHLDNKVVSAWNGMSICAFAKASYFLKSYSKDYLSQAKKIAEFVRKHLWDEKRRVLKRSYCGGIATVDGFADDYAWTIKGLLELYRHSTELKWLQWAVQFQDTMDRLFYDHENGGYYSTRGDDPNILLRMKEEYDSAEPTASSIALGNLTQLAALTSSKDEDYTRKINQTIQCFSERLKKMPIAMPQFISSMHQYNLSLSPKKVVICGSVQDERTQKLLDVVHEVSQPGTALLFVDLANQDDLQFWKECSMENMRVLGDLIDLKEPGESPVILKEPSEPLAYVCINFTCKAPTSNPEILQTQLTDTSTPVKTEVNIDTLLKKQ